MDVREDLPEDHKQLGMTKRKIRVLFLENNNADVQLIKLELEKNHYEVIGQVVDTKEDFVRALKLFHPDIVLCDNNVPGYDGISAVKYLDSQYDNLPVIIVTSSPNEESAVEVMKNGAWDYVIKDQLSHIAPAVTRALHTRDVKKQKINALRQLKESEMRYRSLYEHAGTGLFRSTVDGTRFIAFNHTFAKILGYSKDQLLNLRPLDLWYIPEEREFFIRKIREKKELTGFKTRLIHASGRNIYVLISSRYFPEDEWIEGSITDITQTHRDELLRDIIYNISESSTTKGTLKELLITISFELNRLIKSKNLLIGIVNRATGKLELPYMRDAHKLVRTYPLKLSISKLVIESGEPMFLKKERLLRLEKEGKLKMVRKVPAVWLGVPLSMGEKVFGILALQDYENPDAFTEEDMRLLTYVAKQVSLAIHKKKYEEEIRRLKMGVEQSPISIVFTDPAGNIEYVNPFFENITGYTFDEVRGKNPRILKSGKTPEHTYRELWDTVTKGKVWKGEFLNLKKNGEHYWESAVISPVYDEHGKLINYIGLKEDITLRKQYEQGLEEARRKAEESDHLKNIFLTNISHELRTPLNAIIGFAEIIEHSFMNPEVCDHAANIHYSGIQLLRIIEDILNLSLIESGNLKLVNKEFRVDSLEKILQEHYDTINKKYKKDDVSFSLQFQQELRNKKIVSDRNYISYLLNILTDNALKFTQRGKVEAFLEMDKDHLVIRIKDTGIGIPPDKKEVIFDKFRQIEETITRRYGGTGVGLTIAKSILDMMGGTISVHSEPGQGSEFTISIPGLKKEKEKIAEMETNQFRPDLLQGIKILVAEDEELNYLLLKGLLSRYGAKLVRAGNGKEALELYSENPDTGLVLMDIRMPVMNGLEATEKLKQKNPELPVIAITAYSMQEDKDRAFEAGCDEFLTKPVDRDKLYEAIGKFLTN